MNVALGKEGRVMRATVRVKDVLLKETASEVSKQTGAATGVQSELQTAHSPVHAAGLHCHLWQIPHNKTDTLRHSGDMR